MLSCHYLKAWQGYRIWKKIDKKYQAPMYILMPKEKDEYNYYALQYLEQYLERKKLRKAVVLTCDEEAIAALDLFVAKSMVRAVHISRDEAVKLVKYYALHEFTSRIVIVSLSEPYDTHAENLIGVRGVEKSDLVCFDIYRFSEKPEAAQIHYSGNDEKVIAFLGRAEKKRVKGILNGTDREGSKAAE